MDIYFPNGPHDWYFGEFNIYETTLHLWWILDKRYTPYYNGWINVLSKVYWVVELVETWSCHLSGPAPHSSRWLINQVQNFRTNQCTYSPISIALLFQYLSSRIYKLNWEVDFVFHFYIFENYWAIGGVGLSGRYSDEVWKLHFSSILLSCQEKNSSLGNRYTVLILLYIGRSMRSLSS